MHMVSESYRLGTRGIQALPPQTDSLHWSKVWRVPVKPFIVSTAPLAVVDKDPLSVEVDLFNRGRIPEGMKMYCKMRYHQILKVNATKMWISRFTLFRKGYSLKCNQESVIEVCVVLHKCVNVQSRPILLSISGFQLCSNLESDSWPFRRSLHLQKELVRCAKY